ncbi:hypothetical protein BOX15_Mlig014578g3 [Macrostomum lignano]|uniref:Uncharacterized protein n=1 Tax=Macrostomum lignano TaxID=282301 RepID=A0A267G9Y1_9PLAT|nr:hypothetical protein BOX15_Mlig014578g1 [Macrostomum lignano]PAA82204.1 hypothetical protein BOX15_Mlig014578g3 [Macrostomum lignano]
MPWILICCPFRISCSDCRKARKHAKHRGVREPCCHYHYIYIPGSVPYDQVEQFRTTEMDNSK